MRSSAVLVVAIFLLIIGAGAAVWFVTKSPQTVDSPSLVSSESNTTKPADRPIAGDARPAGVPAPQDAPKPAVADQEPASRSARVAVEDEKPAAETKIEHWGTVVGQVVDFNGEPAGEVKVRIVGKQGVGMLGGPDAVTGADGKFSAKLKVNKKKTMRLRLTRTDRIAITVPELVLKRDETTDVGTLQFEPSGGLEVVVLDGTNKPVPNAQVHLKNLVDEGKEADLDASNFVRKRDEDPSVMMERAAKFTSGERTTDELGVAHYAALPPGRFRVSVDLSNAGFGRPSASARRTNGGARAGVNVSVSVEDKEKPANAPDFDLGAATPVKSDPKEIVVTAGKTDRIEMPLRGLANFTGRAFIQGKPLANEWLGLRTSSSSGMPFSQFIPGVRTQTDKNGKFTFPPVGPGDYVVSKGDPGPALRLDKFTDPDQMMEASSEMMGSMFGGKKDRQQDLARSVTLVEGNNQNDIDFAGSRIDIIVQDADSGEPLKGATVKVYDFEVESESNELEEVVKNSFGGLSARAMRSFMPRADGRRAVRLKATSDNLGRAEFNNIESGRYRATARVSDRPPSIPSNFELVTGEARQVIVKVPRSSQILGSVNDHTGNAIAGATVRILLQNDPEPSFPEEMFVGLMGATGASTLSDAKGMFKLTGMPAGAHKIVAIATGYAPALLDSSAPSDGNQFFLNKNGSIRIRVTRDGRPAKGVMVSLDKNAKDAPVSPEAWSALGLIEFTSMQDHMDSTDENGYATLKNVPPGDWPVSVRSFGKDSMAPPIAEPAEASTPTPVDSPVNVNNSNTDTKNHAKAFDQILNQGRRTVRVRVTSESEAQASCELK